MGDELNPALYQGILDMTGRGLHLKQASRDGAPGIRGQDPTFQPIKQTPEMQQTALVNHLMKQYKLPVQEAETYAAHYMKQSDPTAVKMREEAFKAQIPKGEFRDRVDPAVEGFWRAREAAQLQEAQDRANRAKSEATVGAFVLGGMEKAKYKGMTPATEAVYMGQSQATNPYKVPIKPIDAPASNKRVIPVPNGPYGYNYEEEAEPQLIPNAPSVPVGPHVPGKLMAPTDPEEYQRWLAALPGGSL